MKFSPPATVSVFIQRVAVRDFKMSGCDETALIFTAALLFLFISPPFLIRAVVFLYETETCVSTNEEAGDNLEKSQCSYLNIWVRLNVLVNNESVDKTAEENMHAHVVII